jgi:5-(carboxyamino)imidazole ribonucleotide mutase
MNEHIDEQQLIDQLHEEADADVPSDKAPDIGIIMGSDSDFDVMMGDGENDGAYDALMELGFGEVTTYGEPTEETFTFESWVVSAHRTPDLMYAYGKTASERGLDVIIAGAGGKSADLPNMTASIAYPLPVIGVPVQEKSVPSVIGMPTGAPIVAVDAGKSFNAALFAVQILARKHNELTERLEAYHDQLKTSVSEVSREMHQSTTPEFRRRDES